MLDELSLRAADAVTMAKDAGAGDVWASAGLSRDVTFTWREGRLEKVEESTARSVGVQIYAQGRYATHSTTDLRPEQLRGFLREAVAMTRALQPDPHRLIPDPALFEGRSDVDLDQVDANLASFGREERAALCAELEAAAHADERVISATSYVSDTYAASAHASSNGFVGQRDGTQLWYGAEVTVRDAGDRRPEESRWVGGRHLAGLPTAAEVGGEALALALRRLGSEKGPTTRATMVVDPRAAGRLVSSLFGPSDARSVQQERSFWAGVLGQPFVSDKLTVSDEPLLPRGFGSRLYDGEGIAARPLPLIEAGVARNLFVDTYYGRKLGVAPTTGGYSNLVVAPGERALEALLADVSDGIYVTAWLGGNSDPTTGDFSFGLRGHRIAGGRIGAPVGEMNVTGRLPALFGALAEVGRDPWPYGRLLAPALVFEGVQFSGA